MKKLLLITLLASNTMLSTWKDFIDPTTLTTMVVVAASGCYSTYYGYGEYKQNDKAKKQKINGALSMTTGVGTIVVALIVSHGTIIKKPK